MKKQVIKSLLLVFISFVCQAQMIRNNYVGDPFNYVTYTSPCNTYWVIIQPGHGGASFTIDQLAMYGYGRMASTQDLPFNILIVQAKKGTNSWLDDYTPISKRWPETLQKLGIKRAVLKLIVALTDYPYATNPLYQPVIVEAQQEVADDFFTTADMTRAPDGIHFPSAGSEELGSRFYDKILPSP